MRQHAAQVPESVSRLLRSTLLQKPPTWFLPVLSNPPPVQPARASAQRHTRLPSGTAAPKYNDARPHRIDAHAEGRTRTHSMKNLRERKPRAEAIVYEEDVIRRRFFADFPFEALRPVSLTEGREIRAEEGVSGKEWRRLDQRGAYPTVESTIAFTLNLHHSLGKPMSEAYEIATGQFSELRARHELATLAAESEARHHGAEFKPTPFERVHAKEQQALATLASAYSSNASSSSASTSTKYRKPTRWSVDAPGSASSQSEFSSGQQYIDKWKLPPPPPAEGEESSATPAESAAAQQGGRGPSSRYEPDPDNELDDEAFIRQELQIPSTARA